MTELKMKRRSFNVIGRVKLPQEGLDSAKTNEANTWLGVRTGFSVETADGNLVHVTIQGGRSLKTGVLYALPKEAGSGMIKVPFADREKEEVLSKIAESSFLKVRLGNDKSFKTIDTIDYVEYLKEHLKDGMEVGVRGLVEYSESIRDGESRVYRNLNVNAIYLNETVNDELRYEKKAEMIQTFLVTEDSLERGYAKELEKEGRTVLRLFVPQYLSSVKNKKGEYVPYKRTVALSQPVVLTVDKENAEEVERKKKILERVFKAKRGKVLVRDLVLDIHEGYEKTEGKIEITKEMQGLIDDGILTEEDLRSAPTISSTRISELRYKQFQMVKNDETGASGFSDVEYTSDILIRAVVEDEDEDQWEFETKEKTVTNKKDDFDDLFSLDIGEDDLPF